MKMIKWLSLILVIPSMSFASEEVLKSFENQAKKENSTFKEFSVNDGEKLFRLERANSKNEKIGCTTCHTANPKAPGLSRANKIIDPLAPIASKERFTDMAKVEKWFKRNCKDVLERECTVLEKGNFTKFMMSVK
ncbi:MAG: DUF1924 domain-containing protein [Bacteriovorax sp.]|jgi:hypothetical protein